MTFLRSTPANLFFKDTECRYLFISDVRTFFPYGEGQEEDVLGKTDLEIWSSEEQARFYYEQDQKVLATGKGTGYITEVPRKDGTAYYQIKKNPVVLEGKIIGIVGLIGDITERVRLEKQAENWAVHDELTGLYNRNYLKVKGAEQLKGAIMPITIIMGDCNYLKRVNDAYGHEYGDLLLEGTRDTLIMIGVSTVFAYLIGLPLGVLLSISQPHGIWPHKWFNRILGWIINVGRSLPFIILMIAIMDFTKLIVGTKLGVPGAIVPLVVSAAPFIARMVETSLNEVDAGVVEAAQSMGASTLQIVWKVYLPEAKPCLILGGAISLVTILAYTAIAGTVGAGGLGDIAVRYGHQRGITSVMWVTVVFLIILVQVVQLIFNWLSRRIDKRLDQPSGAKKSGPLDLLPRFAHTK